MRNPDPERNRALHGSKMHWHAEQEKSEVHARNRRAKLNRKLAEHGKV